jgi:tetratricopeptide (TPR) repeat protein/energy-coupling factor transporter ATP-binding protein EcfA2
MSLVAHKYTPSEMSEQELEATFAARGHTVDYLLKSLREQIHSGTLSSFVITGPRGSGKSTVIQMVALRIKQDPGLQAAWLPVVFPEEQFNIGSLRDLMAATLQMLVKQGISPANVWLEKVEAETNEEQSLQLAVTGLREVTRQQGKRLVLFIENLNQLLEECLNDQMKGTFRRLLMSDPFMMVIGSTVHLFDSLKDYDESFFNYFGQVMLDRLTAEEVFELLRLRAVFDGNHEFLKELPGHQSKIRAIVLLSGGNPRLVLMLYELLTQRKVTTILQCLTRLVDELTPLLKHEIENLPPQQRQIIHALMEKGGAAQPTDLVGPTRLPLNAITTQLGRLKEAQFVEVLGGGKGRTANYTVSDKLFSVWYRMRYLGQNRRRIEMFVEVLRVWFEEEERLVTLRKLALPEQGGAAQFLRDSATTAEYFAASLQGTPHERLATGLCIDQWAKADLREAAFAYADLSCGAGEMPDLDEIRAYKGLGDFFFEHGDPHRAIEALNLVIAKHPTDVRALNNRGIAKRQLGDNHGAISDYTAVIKLEDAPEEEVARALVDRGATKGLSGDVQGAISDCNAVIEMEDAPKEQTALALFNRGIAKCQFNDIHGAISDYTGVIELEGAPSETVALALFNRGVAKRQLGDNPGAISDYNALIEMEGVPDQYVARALFNRGNAKHQLGDMPAAISDYTAFTEMEGVRVEDVARALVNRGVTKRRLGDAEGAISDWSAVIDMVGVPNEQRARAFFGRWLTFRRQDETLAVDDLLKVIDLAVMTDDLVVHAAKLAYRILWVGKDYSGAKDVVTKLGGIVNSLPKELASPTALRFLNWITAPGLKDAWAAAWRVLAETSRPEVAEALHFLEPVCAVLEGKDRAVLDGLPPEQREFAENVLKSFEAKPN